MTTNEPPPYPGEPNPSTNEPTNPPPPSGEPPSYGSAPPPPGAYPPPPAGGYPPPPAGGYPPPPGSYPPPAPGGYGAPLESNKKALWSMISGIISLFCCGVVLGPVAIVLSNQAKSEIAATGGTQPGLGQAKAGLILGIIGIVGWVFIILVRLSTINS
jgi:hypothetical protein